MLLQRMPMILAFTTRNVAEICCEFLRLLSCICWGTPKNMDTAEWNSKMLRILSLLSPLSLRFKPEPIKQCTTLSKHGALYSRTVDLPNQVDVTDFRYIHFLSSCPEQVPACSVFCGISGKHASCQCLRAFLMPGWNALTLHMICTIMVVRGGERYGYKHDFSYGF